MTPVQRTAEEWFAEAARCYIECHQGCAWCGGQHRVFRREEGRQLTYYCHGCDFRTSHDEETGWYHFIPGEKPSGPPTATMLAI